MIRTLVLRSAVRLTHLTCSGSALVRLCRMIRAHMCERNVVKEPLICERGRRKLIVEESHFAVFGALQGFLGGSPVRSAGQQSRRKRTGGTERHCD